MYSVLAVVLVTVALVKADASPLLFSKHQSPATGASVLMQQNAIRADTHDTEVDEAPPTAMEGGSNVGYVSGIAFHASCSKWYTYTPNQIVDLSNVISNFGGYFSAVESAFVCPDYGVYYFQASAQLQDNAHKAQVEFSATDGSNYWFTLDGTAGQGAVMQGMFFKCSPAVRVYVTRHGSVGGPSVALWINFYGFRFADA